MHINSRAVVAAALLFTGCSAPSEEKQPQAVAEAQALAKALKGGDKQSPLCALFTQAEIELMLGAPVSPGETAGPLGTACQWNGSADESAYLQIQVIDDPHYWSKQSLAPGYEQLDGIAKEAFVVPELGGYAAHALTEKQVVAIGMKGGSTSRDAAVAALRTVLERLNRSP